MHSGSPASEKKTAPEAFWGRKPPTGGFTSGKLSSGDGIRKPIDELLSPGTVPNNQEISRGLDTGTFPKNLDLRSFWRE
jgi:hypothetical protein